MARSTNLLTDKRPEEAKAGAAGTRRSVVLFHVASQTYAVPLATVQEIVPMAQLSRPPGLPGLLEGFLNLGGTAVPVVRLARLFGAADVPVGLHTPLLILRGTEFPLALLVDKVSSIVAVAEKSVLPVREDYSFNDCAEGVLTIDKALVILLSPERILLEKERRCLAEAAALEQARLGDLQGGPA